MSSPWRARGISSPAQNGLGDKLALLESAFSEAANASLDAEDPVLAAALHLLRQSTSSTSGARTSVAPLRVELRRLYAAIADCHDSLDSLQRSRDRVMSTSRSGFLRTITDLVGPHPEDRTWRDEWPELTKAQAGGFTSKRSLEPAVSWRDMPEIEPSSPGSPGSPVDKRIFSRRSANRISANSSIFLMCKTVKVDQVNSMVAFGWPREDAEMFVTIDSVSRPIAQALRDSDPRFAAATHTICSKLYERGLSQSVLPPMLYCHLYGVASLTAADEAWHDLLKPDLTGFQGLTSMALVTGTDIPNNFTSGGFAVRIRDGIRIYYDVDDEIPYMVVGKNPGEVPEPFTAPVVGFESAEVDQDGQIHAAVMTAKHSGTFPPNCLFALERIEEGFVHNGVHVQQQVRAERRTRTEARRTRQQRSRQLRTSHTWRRTPPQLYVVSATYLKPAAPDEDGGDDNSGSKFATPTLRYATREVCSSVQIQ